MRAKFSCCLNVRYQSLIITIISTAFIATFPNRARDCVKLVTEYDCFGAI